MEPVTKEPTLAELKSFLEGFGWNFRETSGDNKKQLLVAPYLRNDGKGILISFHIEGEFVMVGTVGFIKRLPSEFAKDLLMISEVIKLVKVYVTHKDHDGSLNAEVGFELWNESWNKKTFYDFLDMLCFGIEKTTQELKEKNINYETDFINIINSKES